MARIALPVLIAVVLASAPLSAQVAQPDIPADYQRLLAQYNEAQATAQRPGDDKLSCDELEQQIVAVANDPTMQAFAASPAAAAQADAGAIRRTRTAMATRTLATAAASIAAALLPGGNMVNMPAMTAAAADGLVQQAQAAQRMQARTRRIEELLKLLPQLIRGQRLTAIAMSRNCEWMTVSNGSR